MTNEQKAIFLWEQGLSSRKSYFIINKKFEVSMEDLQDKPELIKKEILEYLKKHAQRINRIEIEPHVDENTFKPSVIIRLHTNISLVDSIISKLFSKLDDRSSVSCPK